MITAIAAFAEAFINPLAPLLALGTASFVHSQWLLRLVAALAGCLLALMAHFGAGFAELSLSMLGAALALLLHAEIALHLILPGLRWLRRCAATAWQLAGLVLAMTSRLWPRPRPDGPAPPRKDRTP